jgi:hypothetical protein
MLGNEPIIEEMPVEFQDLPYIIQEYLKVFYLLPDIWEGFSGSYMGKDFSVLPYFLDLYEIADKKEAISYIHIFIRHMAEYYQQKAAAKKSADSAKKLAKNKPL